MLALSTRSGLASAEPILREPSPSELEAAFEAGLAATDSTYELASTDDLDRHGAIGAIEGLFGPLLETPSGIFDELEVERYLSDHLAILPAGEGPSASAPTGGSWAGEVGGGGRALLESTIPLRTEASDGEVAPVDLSLEPRGGGLQPVNPIADLVLPGTLSDGIVLPAAGIRIDLANAPDRSPSVAAGNVAFYPNVGEDTDFLAAPTPAGVEAFVTIRSPEAPSAHEYVLELPPDAELRPSTEGGAEVVQGDVVVLTVRAPSAVDAVGDPVPVSLAVAGSRIRVEATLTAGTPLPVVVDPTFEETYNFLDGTSGWTPYKDPATQPVNNYSTPGRICVLGACALTLDAKVGAYGQNALTSWNYAVPRFSQDMAAGKVPTSFIKSALLNLTYGQEGNDWAASPGALFWMSNEQGAWQVANLYPPNQSGSWGYDMGTSKASKQLGFALIANEPRTTTKPRYLWVSGAQVVIGDNDSPSGSAGGPGWVDEVAKPIDLDLTDTGLGMKSVQIVASSLMPSGVPSSWKASLSCSGGAKDPCPRAWKSGSGGVPALPYDPATMSEGVHQLTVRAADALNNGATTTVNVKVDHSPPAVGVGGTITEQSVVGVTLPRYTVKATATDGSASAPQSGVEKVTVKVDGGLVEVVPTGCGADSCSASPTVNVDTGTLSPGSHQLEVLATDRVGNVSAPVVKTFEVQPDTTAPSLAVSGGVKNAAGGWLLQSQSPYLILSATDAGAGVEEIQFLVDGQVKRDVAASSCPDGGCPLFSSSIFKVSTLALGAHHAEVTARDFAGRVSSQSWTFGVNSSGEVTAAGAELITDALSAGSTTAVPKSAIGYLPYDPTLGATPPVFEEGGTAESVEIVGSGVAGRIAEDDPATGAVLEPAGGLPFVLAPLDESGAALDVAPAASGDAVVYANVRSGTDVITRPLRNGVANALTMRTTNGAASFSWKVIAADPVSLDLRQDGGVNVVIDPSVEVPTVDYEDSGELTDAPQAVASIPAPLVADGKGNAVSSSWTVSGDQLTLQIGSTIQSSMLPVQAEMTVHVQGGLQAWMPSTVDPSGPSGKELTASASEETEPFPISSEAEAINEGMELSLFLPEFPESAATVQMDPPPGTEMGPIVIAAPVGKFAPVPGVEYLGLLPGFHAGHVGCGIGGPDLPLKVGSLAIQTYGFMNCALSGERPPNYGGAKLGVCLMFRMSLNGNAVFSHAKCKSGQWSGYPKALLTVTQSCNNNVVYKGKTDGGPIFKGAAVLNTEWTKYAERC